MNLQMTKPLELIERSGYIRKMDSPAVVGCDISPNGARKTLMRWFHFWVLIIPVTFLLLGILILAGYLFPRDSVGEQLRTIVGVVLILFGAYRGFYYGFELRRLSKKAKESAAVEDGP